ncbi:MAG: UvrD-helicase domain-containing protein [Nitrospirae bacterium]|nr:UvrD-helicase domain-containing protein [Nitrospirota bacterium]
MADINNTVSNEHTFPHSIVLKASAGSGKTHALTLRFVAFLLSKTIKKNGLRNILAITFSNNAAAEMRSRILLWLKALSLGQDAAIKDLKAETGLDRDELMTRATATLSLVLDHYADLQVKTIDSFMTGIFKASAIDLGYNPDFDVVLQNDALMEYAFDMFLKNVREKSEASRFLEAMIGRIMESKLQTSGFPWDPSAPILDEVKSIYRKTASTWKTIRTRDHTPEIAEQKAKIRTAAEELEALIERSAFERNSKSTFPAVLDLVRQDRFPDILSKGMKTQPIKSYKGKDAEKKLSYDEIIGKWETVVCELATYICLHAESYYFPYLRVYEAIRETIERVKRKEETVFIEDINHNLAEYIQKDIVPDVYFRIGETVYHYLIDEFQDTSPVQWKNLFPLVENSLAEFGSLFVVGDTKQAIYGFRDADYRIMREMENPDKRPFPSAHHQVKELDTNYRSLQEIIDFNARVFKQKVAADEEYGCIAARSGLTDYIQKVKAGNEGKGHVQIRIIEQEGDETPERAEVQDLLTGLTSRGYGLRDIAILTFDNDDVVNITAWLNEQGIDFVSYSSLDIRRRKVIVEIVSLLRFLDSPLDDLSFSIVLLGDIFSPMLRDAGIGLEQMQEFIFSHRRNRPLYKSFQPAFPALWERCFNGLFRSAGYLPLYDLVTEVFRIFGIFPAFREEEAALAKMLEVVKTYEQSGKNSLRDFIEFVTDEERNEADWNIDLPKEMEAVKVMTVHKAKGMEFPVVILLIYGKTSKGFSHVLKEISKTEDLCFTRLNKNIADKVEELGCLYDELSAKETVNSLNSLYVALTRAGAEMYVLCVQNKTRKESYHACRFLPDEEYPALDMPAEIFPGEKRQSRKIALEHGNIRALAAVSAEKSMNVAEKQWGEFIHQVLSHIDIWETGRESFVSEIIKKVNREFMTSYPDEPVCSLIHGFLDCPAVKDLFSERAGRIVQKETEIADSKGNLFRLDRLIIDPECVTVIDFKTGRDQEKESGYLRQIRNYMNILAALYADKKIIGMIAYVELMQVRMVS